MGGIFGKSAERVVAEVRHTCIEQDEQRTKKIKRETSTGGNDMKLAW